MQEDQLNCSYNYSGHFVHCECLVQTVLLWAGVAFLKQLELLMPDYRELIRLAILLYLSLLLYLVCSIVRGKCIQHTVHT